MTKCMPSKKDFLERTMKLNRLEKEQVSDLIDCNEHEFFIER